jgi:DNA mismatch endonuclease (patch repair protein)
MQKLCECGCKKLAPISPVNHKKWNYVKGQPRRFVRGHANKGIKYPPEIARKIGNNGAGTQFKKGHKHSKKIIEVIRAKRVTQRFPLKRSSIEVKISDALVKRGIKHKTNIPLEGICQPDMFIEPNIVIFCDGDYWHNINSYKVRDRRINKLLLKKGYKVIRIWQHEIDENIDKCIDKIICQT